MYYILLPVAWLVWHLGFRIRVVGRENIPRGRGYVLAPNHISAIDPVFVIVARFWGRRMCVFAKRELFEKNAFITWFIRQAGALCVRGAKDELAAVNTAVAQCRARAAGIPGGHALEGRAARSGEERRVCGGERGGRGYGALPDSLRHAGR